MVTDPNDWSEWLTSSEHIIVITYNQQGKPVLF